MKLDIQFISYEINVKICTNSDYSNNPKNFCELHFQSLSFLLIWEKELYKPVPKASLAKVGRWEWIQSEDSHGPQIWRSWGFLFDWFFFFDPLREYVLLTYWKSRDFCFPVTLSKISFMMENQNQYMCNQVMLALMQLHWNVEMKEFLLAVSAYASCFRAVGYVPWERGPMLTRSLNVLEGLESIQEFPEPFVH